MMEDDENTLARDRFVRIMCDYGSEGVWDKEGCGCCIDDLLVSPELAKRILDWQYRYEKLDPVSGDPAALDVEMFSQEGLQIAREVKAQLPDWTVIYFDESRIKLDGPRTTFEYEITLDQ